MCSCLDGTGTALLVLTELMIIMACAVFMISIIVLLIMKIMKAADQDILNALSRKNTKPEET